MSILGSGSVHVAQRFAKKPAKSATAANVVCQKCLQPGHWTYECKNSAVYQMRPSRTKQLKDPKRRQAFMDPNQLLPEMQAKKEKEAKESSSDSSDSSSSDSDASSSSSGSDSSSASSSDSGSSSESDSDSDSSSSSGSSDSSGSDSESDSSTSGSGSSSSSGDSDAEADAPRAKKKLKGSDERSTEDKLVVPERSTRQIKDQPKSEIRHHAQVVKDAEPVERRARESISGRDEDRHRRREERQPSSRHSRDHREKGRQESRQSYEAVDRKRHRSPRIEPQRREPQSSPDNERWQMA